MIRCPFCSEQLKAEACADGGYAMRCVCAFQGPKRTTRLRARRVFADWLIGRAISAPEFTSDELSALIEACNVASRHNPRPPWDRAGHSAWRKLIEEERLAATLAGAPKKPTEAN